MGQLELLGRDATQHGVYFAALPDAPMRHGAREIALDVRQRLALAATPIAAERLHVSLLSVGDSPHLTMMYDESRTCDFPILPIGWTVSRFARVDSLFGQSRHVHLGQWDL